MSEDEILEDVVTLLDFKSFDIKGFTLDLSDHISNKGLQIGNFPNPQKLAWEVAKSLMSKHKLDMQYKNDIKIEIRSKILSEKISDQYIQTIIDDQFMSKNEKIRKLLDSGISISQISKSLGIEYQRVKNVYKKYIKKQ